MNKVFKVIWSEARNAYVVVSEIAKNHGSKSCSTKKLLTMLIATGVMTCASVAPAMAANLAPEDTKIEAGDGAAAKGSEGVAIGKNSEASAYGYATAIGGDAKATGSKSTVVGNYSKATEAGTISIGYGNLSSGANAITIGHEAIAAGMNSFAFGSKANASGESSVAFGNGSKATHLIAIAIGSGAAATDKETIAIGGSAKATSLYSVAIGNHIDKTGEKAVAIGQQTRAYGKHSTAVGAGSQAQYTGATAIGTFAKATKEGSIALGYNSYADREAGVKGYDPLTGKESTLTSLAWKSGKGALSIGSAGGARQIINVAAGSEDTDAVNVAQLKKVAVEAGKHTTLVAGDNVTLDKKETNKGLEYTVNAVDTKYTAGNGIAIDEAANNAISVNLKNGENNLVVNESGLALKSDLTGIHTISNGKSLVRLDNNGVISILNNSGAGIAMAGGITSINSIVNIDKEGHIKRVAAGEISATSRDAVNGSQLHAVATEAGKHSVVTEGANITVTPEQAENGRMQYNVALNNDILLSGDNDAFVNISGSNGSVWASGSVAAGNVIMDGTTATVSGLGNTTTAYDGFANGEGKAATEEQLKEISKVADNANQGWNLSTNGGEASKVAPGETVDISGDKNISVSHDGTKVKVELNKDLIGIESISNDGAKLTLNGTATELTNGQGASVKLFGDTTTINNAVTVYKDGRIAGVAAGEVSSTSTDAINGSQLHQTNENVAALDKRVTQNEADIAQNKADIAQNKADIAQNKADIAQNKTDIKNLDTRVTNVEELAKKHTTVNKTGDNITVNEGTNAEGGKEYTVNLNKKIELDSVTTGQTVMNNDGLKVGKDVSVTATAVTAGKTSISDEGVKVGDKTYISDKGLNANDQKVTNVAAGEISATSKDAVNGSQLYATNQEVVNNTNCINKLGSRVNKVGAGAAALAALHPMDFDPDDKLTFSAGYGNYAGENAAAIGAYYRPDEKVMFSVAGTVGNGENMVNAGVSFALDRTNHVSNSRTALAREVIDLRGQLAVMGAKMAKMEKAFGMLDETKTKLFPDIPANHWAYEYIAKLAGNGYIEGYPDGNFGGDRLMTRYEFAAMLYRAIENGAALEEKIIKEFEPELGRIRVDRISGEDGDRDKIERVRVNDTKGERDHYGNKLAK